MRIRSLAVLLTFALGPAFAQSYFTSDPTDSPQFTAFILAKPVRIPAEAGGGLLGIGKIAPPSFALTGVKGTPYLYDRIAVSTKGAAGDTSENSWPA